MDARDRREVTLMILHIFERYGELRRRPRWRGRPLPACHKDTVKRLAEAYMRLTDKRND